MHMPAVLPVQLPLVQVAEEAQPATVLLHKLHVIIADLHLHLLTLGQGGILGTRLLGALDMEGRRPQCSRLGRIGAR